MGRGRHPYRSAEPLVHDAGEDGGGRLEELALAIVLTASGAIGLLIGLADPPRSSWELVIGAAVLALGISTGIRRRR